MTLLTQGRPREAIAAARRLTNAHPTDPRVWRLRCEIALHGGALREATESGQKALDLDPTDTSTLIQLGRCLVQTGERGRALQMADSAAARNPTDIQLLDGLGAIYSLAGEPAKALPWFRRAVAQHGGSAQLLTNLAACQRMVGEIAAAEVSCNQALALDARAYQACYIRADLRRWTLEDNHITAMETALKAGRVGWRDEKYLRFALSKEYEDVENYRAAFRHLQAGNALQRSHMRYDVAEDVDVIDSIIATYSSQNLRAATPGYESAEPIFVAGLPRTGTSLVERILGAHSAVYSAGELNDFALALIETGRNSRTDSGGSKHELVGRSLSLDMRALGQRYIERTRPRTGQSPHFVDKLPGNYLYFGLISKALPRARLVLLERDAMDTCYAIYKTLFTGAYPFAYDLNDLGTYYLAYQRLADHWVQSLGSRVLLVRYEKLVTDFECEVRRLLAFCALPWEDSCANYHLSTAAATTASAVQVRRPIYRTSVGNWRAYDQELQPLVALLQTKQRADDREDKRE